MGTRGTSKGTKVAPRRENKSSAVLLENESVSFEDDEVKPKATDEELNARYVKGDVRIVTESARYSLAGILTMLDEQVIVDDTAAEGAKERRYKLDPEYQRRHRWDVQRKSRLIESFLMNVPVPPVFLYERDLARFEVMDGRQRLTALSDFYADRFALEGLQHWADLDGRKYSELPTKVRDGIDRRYISSIILLKETAASEEQAAMLKKLVFERLNSGGVELSSQETRNAVYNGPMNQLCLSLSENESFRRMWGIPLDPLAAPNEGAELEEDDDSTNTGKKMFQRMEDVELVLRFFAYRQISSYRTGLNKMSAFLDRYLLGANRFPKKTLDGCRQMFESTIEFLWETLNTHAFCVGASGRPSKIVYDAIMYVANTAEVVSKRTQLRANSTALVEALHEMYQADDKGQLKLFAGRRTNYSDAQARNERVKKAFADAISRTN